MPPGRLPTGGCSYGGAPPEPGARSTTPILLGIGLLSLLLYLSFALAARGTPLHVELSPLRKGIIPGFLLHFFLLFALYLGAVWCTFRSAAHRHSTLLILLAFSVAFRAILLWTQPILSDDLYRYVWDGKVQAAGINPYEYPPVATELSHLRDETIYPRINRPWARTIYPPGAQWLFRAIYAAKPDSVHFLKTTIAGFDFLTILLLMLLLRAQGLHPGRAILYAWHPLAVFEFAGSGHLDGLMLPFLLLCLLLMGRRRNYWAGASLGVATAIKLYPALLIPALLRRHGPRLLLSTAAVLGLLYLPYVASAGPRVLGFLPQYLSDPGERFNSGPGGLLAYGVGLLSSRPSQVAYGVLAVAILLVSLRGTRAGEKGLDPTIAELLLLFGTFVTFAQTLHPWYLLWIVPLLAIRPSACWLYLSGAIALSYLKYTDDQSHMPLWAGILEYLPFYLLALGATRVRKLRQVGAHLIGQLASGRAS